MRFTIWLSLLVVASAANAQVDLNSWEDLASRIDASGESIVQRIDFGDGSNTLPNDANSLYFDALTPVGESGQLFVATIISSYTDLSGVLQEEKIPYQRVNNGLNPRRIMFSPTIAQSNDIFQFYVYMPSMNDAGTTPSLHIYYEDDNSKNREAWRRVNKPGQPDRPLRYYFGCYRFVVKGGDGEVQAEADLTSTTCNQGGEFIPEWLPPEELTGSGWLRADIGGNLETDGLVLVLQDADHTLTLAQPDSQAVVPAVSNGQSASRNFYGLVILPKENGFGSDNPRVSVECNSENCSQISEEGRLGDSSRADLIQTDDQGNQLSLVTLALDDLVSDTAAIELTLSANGHSCIGTPIVTQDFLEVLVPMTMTCTADPQSNFAQDRVLTFPTRLPDVSVKMTNTNQDEVEQCQTNETTDVGVTVCVPGGAGTVTLEFTTTISDFMNLELRQVVPVDGSEHEGQSLAEHWKPANGPIEYKVKFAKSEGVSSTTLEEMVALVKYNMLGGVDLLTSESDDDSILVTYQLFSEGISESILQEPSRAQTLWLEADQLRFGPEGEEMGISIPVAFLDQMQTPSSIPVIALEQRFINLSNYTISVQSGVPAEQLIVYCDISVRFDDTSYPLEPDNERRKFTFPDNMPDIDTYAQIEVYKKAADFPGREDIDRDTVSQLCGVGESLVKSVAAKDLLDSPLLIAFQRPVMVFYQRSYVDDQTYDSNWRGVIRFRIEPVLELAESRILGLYVADADNQNFSLLEPLGGATPFAAHLLDGMLDEKTDILSLHPATGSNVSISKLLKIAQRLQETSGLAEGDWPDVIVITSDAGNPRCSDYEAAIGKLDGRSDGSQSKLLILVDSIAPNIQRSSTYDEVCSPSGPFDSVTVVTTHIPSLVGSGQFRIDHPNYQKMDQLWRLQIDQFNRLN